MKKWDCFPKLGPTALEAGQAGVIRKELNPGAPGIQLEQT